MSISRLDFAFCPCGERTPIRPSTLAILDGGPQLSKTYTDPIFVACTKCKRVYKFDTAYFLPEPTTMGIGPYSPEAPMTVFQVPIECDALNCKARLLVHALLKSGTTDAGIEEATMWWSTSELFCPSGSGHMFQWPPYR